MTFGCPQNHLQKVKGCYHWGYLQIKLLRPLKVLNIWPIKLDNSILMVLMKGNFKPETWRDCEPGKNGILICWMLQVLLAFSQAPGCLLELFKECKVETPTLQMGVRAGQISSTRRPQIHHITPLTLLNNSSRLWPKQIQFYLTCSSF